jgi:hypothetical protein
MTETPRSLEERLDELLALQKSQVHDPDAFHPDKDAIGVAAWLELSNTPKTQSRYKQRRQLLGYWAVANGRKIEQIRVRSHLTFKIESLVKEADEVLEEIKSNKLRVYETCTRFCTWLQKKGYSSQSRTQFRSLLPEFFLKVLGTRNFNRDKFDSIVPYEKVYTEQTKLVPENDQVRSMTGSANLQYRAILGCFANMGWRIDEILSRKWSDLEIRKEGHARVHIKAEDTKSRYERYGFLTPEVVGWLQKFKASLIEKRQESGWLFPGYHVWHAEDVGRIYQAHGVEYKVTEEMIGYPKYHLRMQIVEIEMKRLFQEAGCKDREDGSAIYSSGSFRRVADSNLSKCGFDRKFIDLTIGHVAGLGANIHYKDWPAVEQQWTERCLSGMTIDKKIEWNVSESAKVKELEARIRSLEAAENPTVKRIEGGYLIWTRKGQKVPDFVPLRLEDKSDESETEDLRK